MEIYNSLKEDLNNKTDYKVQRQHLQGIDQDQGTWPETTLQKQQLEEIFEKNMRPSSPPAPPPSNTTTKTTTKTITMTAAPSGGQSLRQSYQATSPPPQAPPASVTTTDTTLVVDTAVQTLRQSYKASTPTVPFVNRAEEIIKSEMGPQEYDRRLERQNMLFEKGCKKGGFTDFFSTYMASSKLRSHFESATKETKKRASHESGVGALGYAVFDPEERVPLNEFFSQGKVLEVRARHSNSPWSDDDRKTGFRSLSLKFADHPKESPLDFVFQTGYISKFFNADSMQEHIDALEKGGEYVKRHLLSLPVYLQAVIDGFRKMPDSYALLHYHSQMVYDFHAKDERKRVARFRVVSADGSPESGRLSPQDQRDAWFFMLMDKKYGDISPKYLKMEFEERVKRSRVSYKLQIQLHEVTEDDNHMVYNPSIAWDVSDHPWLHLATIHLTNVLNTEVLEPTRFNIANMPDNTLGYPEGTSVYDFNIIPTLRAEIYQYAQKHRPLEPEVPKEGSRVAQYLIHVATGDQTNAGNSDAKCGIYVCIVGTKSRTTYRRLERKLKSDFAPGGRATFSIEDKRVGEFLCLKVYKDKKGPKTDWFLDFIIITTPYNNRCYKLPCNRWLTDDNPIITLRTGNASLASGEQDSYLKLQRSMEIAHKRALYAWVEKDKDAQGDFNGLPGYTSAGWDLSALPKDFRLANEREVDKEWSKHVSASSSFMRTIKNMFKSRKGPVEVEYGDLVTEMMGEESSEALEHVIVHWKDDEEFVRQLINYMAPLKIVECRATPSNFPVTNHMLTGLLEEGRTLEDEMEDGRIFLITFPELEGFSQYEVTPDSESNLEEAVKKLAEDEVSIADSVQLSLKDEDQASIGGDSLQGDGDDKKDKKKKKAKKPKAKPPKELRKYLCAPQVLIYNRAGTLMPLAIQLSQDPPEILHGAQPLIYTMKDNGGDYSDWMVAKMWVKTAAAHTHHLSMHVMGSHLLMEPVAMALRRNLPTCHPVHKLLLPHLHHVIATNALYRKHALPSKKLVEEFLAIGQEEGYMQDFLRQQYASFRLPILNLPDSYAQRGVLEEEVLPGYYYRDDSLLLWEAIQDFVTEIIAIFYDGSSAVNGDKELAAMLTDLRRNGFHRRAEMPERFSTTSELVKFLTNVIYRCSVHHSVSTTTMMDIYAFAPNAPPCLMRPPPLVKRGITGWEEDVVRFMLPPPDLVERYVDTIKLMNRGMDDEDKLGSYKDPMFTDSRAAKVVKEFQSKLRDISRQIKKRNSKLNLSYEYFLPENIVNNISC